MIKKDLNSSHSFDIFQTEEQTIHDMEKLFERISSGELENDGSYKLILVSKLYELLEEYKKLYKRTNRMMRMSDRREHEVRKLNLEMKHKNTLISDSINYASLIQHSLMPEQKNIEKYFYEYFSIWEPKDTVGGDIYLFEELRNENECILMVIDCTGHGVPGAFVTMLVKAVEREVISKIINSDGDVSTSKILQIFNKSIKQILKQDNHLANSNAGFDGGIIYFNKKEKIVRFSGAETPLFFIDENEDLNMIKGDRHSVGYKKSDPDYVFSEHTINLKNGMKFYITTDGFLDQNGGEKSFCFGKKNFKSLIQNNCKKPFKEQKEEFMKQLLQYQGKTERNDDICVIGFEYKE